MFNSYASGGSARASANNYLKINAVSGTLVKNHPKSIFVRATGSSTIFDPTNPRCLFPKAKKETVTKWRRGYAKVGDTYPYEEYEEYEEEVLVDAEVPCIVLQSMIVGDNVFLCEIVKVDDFLEVTGEESV